ncbi:MAG: GNAT family N-acetyltransferase [Thalassovita sp.]
MISVRPLIASDFDDLATLLEGFNSPQAVLSGDEGRRRFNEILTHPGTTVFGADDAGRVVSTATLYLMPSLTEGGRSFGLIENVITLPSHRGQGLGRQVMTVAHQTAWDAGASEVMLLTGVALEARGFYESLGYDGTARHGMLLRCP